jgi:hypothetical protein
VDCEVEVPRRRPLAVGGRGGGRLGLEEISNRLACLELDRWGVGGTSAMPTNGLDWAGNNSLVGLRVPCFLGGTKKKHLTSFTFNN